ncbi:hypothetical protein GQ457_03G014160 [Hibiscus cannabinus]
MKIDNLNDDNYNDYPTIEIYTEQEQHESKVDDGKHIDNGKTIDYFIAEDICDKIDKELKDYDENDMDMLKWKSLEDCIEFYHTYTKVVGFGVRIGKTVKSKIDGQIISKTLVCRKQGYRETKWNILPNKKRKPKPTIRVGCQALIQFKLHERYQFWKVENFHAQHNHEMVKPTQVPYIRSFRKISEVDKMKINIMHNSEIAPNRMMRNFVNEAGSFENVGFIQKDLYNYFQRIKREEVQDGDAETVMAYLFGKQEIDPYFFVSHTRDEHGNLEKLFWCDGISRTDYKTFGHVLAFDTTYKCNTYNKPFVVLVGQLITAGDGYKSLTVITDGDKAMANAIAQVIPEAKHRLCLWHLMRNVKKNGNESFHNGFMNCVDKYRTPTDFERAWTELVQKWVEAYMRGYFYAAMRTTQRCESMNRTLKALLDKKNDVEVQKNNGNIKGDNPTAVQARYFNLASFSMNICHRASQTMKDFNEAKDQFAKMSLKLQGIKVGCKKTTNREFLGIGDPLILETGKGKHKKIKVQASSTNKPSDIEATLDLNSTPKSSPNNPSDRVMKNTNPFQLSKFVYCMPTTYKEGDISKVSYNYEPKNMEDKPTIFNWQPNKDW